MTPRRFWTPAEVALLTERYPHEDTGALARILGWSVGQVHDKAHRLHVKKTAAYLSKLNSKTCAHLALSGKATRFKPGEAPWNAGTHFVAGGGSAETRFKPGQMPHTWRPIGTERISKEGYLQRKVTDTGVTRRDYVPVHRLVWQAAGREIPKGFVLVFRDGNNRNFDIDNLELISRRELMRRNTIHNRGPEIAQLVRLRGAIVRQINQRQGKTS